MSERRPPVEPTIGSAGSDGGASATDGGADGTAGADETGVPPVEVCWPWSEETPEDTVLHECVGTAVGTLTWQECAIPCPNAKSKAVQVLFPEDPMMDPPEGWEWGGAQACCDANALDPEVDGGCVSDCARAACTRALDDLIAKRAGDPPDGCGGNCQERFEFTLDTWIAYLQEHYDDCLTIGTIPGATFGFPNPAQDWGLGAGENAILTIECALDEAIAHTEIGPDCTESLNPPAAAAQGQRWTCDLVGNVQLEGPEGPGQSPLEGTVTYREGLCSSDPCWMNIESLELSAEDFSGGAYSGVDMEASLSPWSGFSLISSGTATLAPLMFGLDVTLTGTLPQQRPSPSSFTMVATDTTTMKTSQGSFEIENAIFAWDDGHKVTITTDPASCTLAP